MQMRWAIHRFTGVWHRESNKLEPTRHDGDIRARCGIEFAPYAKKMYDDVGPNASKDWICKRCARGDR